MGLKKPHGGKGKIMTYYAITVVLTFYGYDLADALYSLDSSYARLRMRALSYVNDETEVDNMIEALKNTLLHDFKAQKVGKIEGFRVHICVF